MCGVMVPIKRYFFYYFFFNASLGEVFKWIFQHFQGRDWLCQSFLPHPKFNFYQISQKHFDA